jgi:hypothetical protein
MLLGGNGEKNFILPKHGEKEGSVDVYEKLDFKKLDFKNHVLKKTQDRGILIKIQ